MIAFIAEIADRGFPLSQAWLKEHVDSICKAHLGDKFPLGGIGQNWTYRLPNGMPRRSRSLALALLRTSVGMLLTLTQMMPGGSYWVKPSKSTTSSHTTFTDLMRWGFKPREVVNVSMSSAPIKRLLLINSMLELKTILLL